MIKMLFLVFCLCMVLVDSRCRWHPPETMFNDRLIHLELDESRFIPGRHLRSASHGSTNLRSTNRKGAIYEIVDRKDAKRNVITGATTGKNSGMARHKNAVPGEAQYKDRNFTVGLDNEGTAHYQLVFDRSWAASDVIYKYISSEPPALFRDVDLTDPGDKIVLARFDHRLAEALEYVDHIKVWISVFPTCMPTLEIGRVPYDFNVTATFELYHSYRNKLVANATQFYSDRGWISDASIIIESEYVQQTKNISLHKNISFNATVESPCGRAWTDTSLEVYNTSQFTYYNLTTGEYFQPQPAFIGDQANSIPRCHRRWQGNVCMVEAKMRLSYENCQVPIAFSVYQAVSHVARFTRRTIRTPRPANFDATRRLPVPDRDDQRYDMCESRACEDENVCTPFHIENEQLMHDGQIMIAQQDVMGSGFIETICRFEVIGFLDDIWSPHIYFRQWVGYNYTFL